MSPATPSAPALPAAAAAAWQAYLAMAASKAAHFEALSATTAPDDERRGPRLARAAQRAARLAEHDACVQRFKTEIRALAATDASAHRALTAAIAAHAAQIVESDA